MPDGAPVLAGADIGGTKLAAGVVDQGGRVLAAARTPTPRSDDAEVLWIALRTPDRAGAGRGRRGRVARAVRHRRGFRRADAAGRKG